MSQVTFDGQVAAVTGAARGLGRTYALAIARLGGAVVVNDLPGVGAAEVVGEIEAVGGRAVAVESDVVTREGGAAVTSTALEAFGRLDALVNNAGILRNARYEDLSDRQIAEVLAVHLTGNFTVSQPAFRAMRESGRGGRIVNISSNTSFGMAGLVNYAAAKAGILGLTASVAAEGEPFGILVNSVLPNATSTIMDGEPIPGFEEDEELVAGFEGVAHRFEPERTAALVAYLASRANQVTGQHFSSMGGRFARVAFAVTAGWMSPEGEPATPQEVADHFEAIAAPDVALLPTNIRDEYRVVASALAGA